MSNQLALNFSYEKVTSMATLIDEHVVVNDLLSMVQLMKKSVTVTASLVVHSLVV